MLNVCKKAKKLFHEKKTEKKFFYSTKLQNSYSDAKKTHQTGNHFLEKQYAKTLKLDEPSEILSIKFAEYFDGKVRSIGIYDGIRNAVAGNQNNNNAVLFSKT